MKTTVANATMKPGAKRRRDNNKPIDMKNYDEFENAMGAHDLRDEI